MKVKAWKKLAGAAAAAAILASLPFTLSASRSGFEAGVSEACADGSGCCVSYSSFCGGRINYESCNPPGGDG